MPTVRIMPRETLAFRETNTQIAPRRSPAIRILVADSGLIQSLLLARALRARPNFQISTVALEVSAIHSSCNRAEPT